MYRKKCEGPMKHGVRLGLVSGAGFGFSYFLSFFTNAFCFYVGAVLMQHGKATFAEIFKVKREAVLDRFTICFIYIHPVIIFCDCLQVLFTLSLSALAFSEASAMAPDTNKARDSAASIFELLDSNPKIDSGNNEGMTLSIVKGDIELQNVSFRYATRPDVQIFRNLCLSIPSGKVHIHKSTLDLNVLSDVQPWLHVNHHFPSADCCTGRRERQRKVDGDQPAGEILQS